MSAILFPLWQVDRAEYEAVCAHLGLEPKAAIHERLNEYLANAPFRHPPPRGFSRRLARGRLTRFRLARLDLATRWVDRGNPVRHVLNAAIALHECDAESFARMADVPTGWRLLPAVTGWLVAWLAGLALTLPWLALQRLRHALDPRGGLDDALLGRTVLVTGVARGLGLDVALECLERGARLVGAVRGEASAARLRALLPPEAPVQFVVADLSTPGSLVDALDAAAVQPGGLRLGVLCAGVKHDGATVLALPALRDTFEVNLFAAAEFAAWFCRDARGGMPTPDAQPRALALVSSMGRWHGMHSTAGYNASKAALSIWGESLEMDLARSGAGAVSVTIVEPGLFESGMVRHRRGLRRLLLAPRRRVAERIVEAALAGRRVLRPPTWFAWLTWAVCAMGRDFRRALFDRVKN